MTLLEIANSYNTILEMRDKEQPYEIVFALYQAVRVLEPHVKFAAKEEVDLIEKLGEIGENGKCVQENGTFKIKENCKRKFLNEREKLYSLHVKIDPIKCDVAPQALTLSQLKALDGIIEFCKAGDK